MKEIKFISELNEEIQITQESDAIRIYRKKTRFWSLKLRKGKMEKILQWIFMK